MRVGLVGSRRLVGLMRADEGKYSDITRDKRS